MDIYLTQQTHQKLCEVFDIKYQPIEFEPITYIGCEHREPWNKGIPHTEDYKNRMREILLKVAPMKGVKHTKETKEKIREARSKQIINHSEETKRKIGNAHKGKIISEEHRKIVSESNKRRVGMKYKKR
jgi:hypothetical protein